MGNPEAYRQKLQECKVMLRESNDTVKEHAKTIRQDRRTIRQHEKEITKHEKSKAALSDKLEKEAGLWATDMDHKHTEPSVLHKREAIHHMIHDDASLEAMTSYNLEKFDYMYDRFVKDSKRRRNAPLFAEDEKSKPGNRCLLGRREVLYLALVRKRHNMRQKALAVMFGINQSTVSRYLEFADKILEKILPTADNTTELIKKAKTRKEAEKIVPDKTLITDATHAQKQRPKNKEQRKKTYSGKKKLHTLNTNILTNKNGLIVAASKTFEGSTHDLTIMKKDPIKLGRMFESMYKKNTPKKYRIIVRADLGYYGMWKYYEGIILIIPDKRKPGKKLTKRQKKRNRQKSKKRIVVEHAIGRIKRWKRLTDPYDGTKEEFRKELNIITDLANFHMLWNKNKKRLKLDY